MIQLTFHDWHDASHVVDALLVAADRADAQLETTTARRYRRIAGDIGDALDRVVPVPSQRTGT